MRLAPVAGSTGPPGSARAGRPHPPAGTVARPANPPLGVFGEVVGARGHASQRVDDATMQCIVGAILSPGSAPFASRPAPVAEASLADAPLLFFGEIVGTRGHAAQHFENALGAGFVRPARSARAALATGSAAPGAETRLGDAALLVVAYVIETRGHPAQNAQDASEGVLVQIADVAP